MLDHQSAYARLVPSTVVVCKDLTNVLPLFRIVLMTLKVFFFLLLLLSFLLLLFLLFYSSTNI